MRLSDFKVLTFDCYGTLIDWETGMIAALKPLTTKVTPTLSRNAILEAHARAESMQQRFTPAKNYREILATVYKRLADEWQVPVTWEECQAYGRSVGDWPAFPDTAEALAYLKKHYKLVILSNVDNASFALSNKRLGVAFDAIYAAEDIGTYKPDLRNFEYMLENIARLGLGKKDILHTAESPVPRPWTGQQDGPRVGMDLPPTCGRRVRRDDEPGRDAEGRFQVHQHGRAGESAPGGDGRRWQITSSVGRVPFHCARDNSLP
jgi:2-haloacid dehalogenase